MNKSHYSDYFRTGNYISKVHLDMLHYWESLDLVGNDAKHARLRFQYMMFMQKLFEDYDLDFTKHRIDRKTGEIQWFIKEPDKK